MRTTQLLLQELDLEADFTRRHLERVPMDRPDLKPHEKSMTLGWLATFIAMLGVTVPAVYSDSADEKGGMFM